MHKARILLITVLLVSCTATPQSNVSTLLTDQEYAVRMVLDATQQPLTLQLSNPVTIQLLTANSTHATIRLQETTYTTTYTQPITHKNIRVQLTQIQ